MVHRAGWGIIWLLTCYAPIPIWLGLLFIYLILWSRSREPENETNINQSSVQFLAGFARLDNCLFSLDGIAFFFLALDVVTGASADQTEVGVAIADILLSTLLIVGGLSLFRRQPLGYASGMGLLFAASALFVGVILVVILQPVLTDAPFVLEDVIVLSGMALICFIPTGLFMRGMLSKGK